LLWKNRFINSCCWNLLFAFDAFASDFFILPSEATSDALIYVCVLMMSAINPEYFKNKKTSISAFVKKLQ
jgi:xanthine/uracil/vitamin C permease (AzgA family)